MIAIVIMTEPAKALAKIKIKYILFIRPVNMLYY